GTVPQRGLGRPRHRGAGRPLRRRARCPAGQRRPPGAPGRPGGRAGRADGPLAPGRVRPGRRRGPAGVAVGGGPGGHGRRGGAMTAATATAPVTRSRADRRRRAGLAACLVSATGFGALPVLGKAAYDAGLGPLALLWGRFGLAALCFWGLVLFVVRPARPPARFVVAGLLMGALGYAVEAGLFFVALTKVDASLVELLLYAYPAIVTAVALGAGREAPAPRLA